MRVLHVITAAELGGAQRYAAELARRQRCCGHEVELATARPGWLTDQADGFAALHFVPELVREIAPRRDGAALLALFRLARRRRYDVVHTHSSKAGVVGRVAAAAAGVPFVAHTSHGSPLAERLSLGRRAAYWIAEQAAALVTDRLFAVSETERAFLRRSIRTRPGALRVMTIVPAHIRALPRAWSLGEDRRWDLVAVGNLYANKGYDVLLDAVALLAGDHPRLRLTIYGDGPERAGLAARIGRLRLGERVLLGGRLDGVASALAGAGVYVLPSLKEGLPLALLEALATGAPVAATDVGAVREVLGPAVPLARPGDPAALARLIVELLSSDDRRLAVARAARAAYERLLARDDPNLACGMYA